MTTIFIVSGTSWVVPGDWNNASNSIETIGAGGGGGSGITNNVTPCGGGGGAYSIISNATVTGTQTVQVGAAGAGATTNGTAGGTGTDTWVRIDGGGTAPANTTQGVMAKGGGGGTGSGTPTPGAGGAAASGVGTTRTNGGTGGAQSNNGWGASGGGGAAGPLGVGATGGASTASDTSSGGGAGGGGNGGGGNGVDQATNNNTSGKNGGTAQNGTAGGIGGVTTTAAGNGSQGSGGGGGGALAGTGVSTTGNGGNGLEYDATHGSGGGGGGGGGTNDTTRSAVGGNGGLYGGAGGGGGNCGSGTASNGGSGAQGLIIITYTAAGGGGTPSGSSDYYGVRIIQEMMINSANPHLLPYDSYPPRGNVPSPVVPYGKTDYYDVRLPSAVIRLPKGSQMQHDAYPTRFVQQIAPPGAGGPVSYYDARPPVVSKAGKPKTFTFPFDGFQPRGTINSITPQGMTWPYDSKPLSRRGRPELLTYDGRSDTSYVVVAVPSGSVSFYDIDKYPPLRFRDQHDTYPAMGNVPTAATPQGWSAFFDEDHPPKGKPHLIFDFDQIAEQAPFVSPQGWTSFFDIDQVPRAKVHLIPIDQDQTPDLPPFAATLGWTAFFDVEVIKGKPRDYIDAPSPPAQAVAAVYGATAYYDLRTLRPILTQQYESYPARGLVPTAATPQGWWTPFDIARGKPVSTSLQQFDSYQHYIPPGVVNLGPLGWSMFWDRGKRPLAPDRMPFEFEQRFQVPTATTPQGWTYELGRARVRSFPVQLQQYDALMRMVVPPLVTVSFDAIAVNIIRPRAVPYNILDRDAPAPSAPPMAWVSFPELFKRPRAVPYNVWPEQRVAVLNTPAGAGGVTYFYDRRLYVAHRPPVETMPFDGRGLPFVVVTVIVHRPSESGLLTPVILTGTKGQPTLSGIKANPDLSGEVED